MADASGIPEKKRGRRKEEPSTEVVEKDITRDTELVHDRGKDGDELKEKLLKLYATVETGYVNQAQRSDDQMDYWDAYDCILGGYQAYSGNAQIFVPLIYNAVNARATRFVNQLFPKGGRYVEVVSSDGEEPHAMVALLEHYVRKAKLRTEVAPALCVNGDIEGQYNVYVGWSTKSRHVAWRETKPVEDETGGAIEGVGDEVEEIVEDVIPDDHPIVEVIPDSDVSILPATANSVEEALELGGSVTIIRRWTEAQLEQMKEDGDIVETEAEALLETMGQWNEKQGQTNPAKKHADAAGIIAKGKILQGYETWAKLDIDGEKRLCMIKFGGEKVILSAKLNPYWNDRCPLISVPVRKVAGVAKGKSPAEPCMKLQYAANDALNEGMDSATYALLPIIMTDPLKNPKTNTMILDLAAVWEVDPNSTKFAEFPQLYKAAFEIIPNLRAAVEQTLSVSPAMLPQSTGGRSKRNQAEIALEQQVEILSTADAVTVQEEGVWTPVLTRFAEYDAQFREDDITVRAFGHMGMRASMERVKPLQLGTRYNFLWYGVEQARNAAARQQQIALMNVLRGIPPQLLPGRKLNLVPAIDAIVSDVFSSRIAPYIFEDLSKQFSYDPAQENKLLVEGQNWPVSPMDDDAKHMQVHQQAVEETGDSTGAIRQHINWHRAAQVMKAMAAQMQQQGNPGTPGGAGPGIAGQPRMGAQPANPRQNKGPAGMISQDRMSAAGAPVPPRKM